MVRSADPTIKKRLLDKCLDALIEKGLSEFSLRKMAQQADTSARMLVYHFGSADALFAEIIVTYSHREKSRIKTALESRQELNSLSAFIAFNWKAYLAEERINVLKAFVEIYGLCLRDKEKYNAFFQEILHEWLDLLQEILEKRCGLSSNDSKSWSTLIVATCRGLLLDRLASDEPQRVVEALALFQGLANAYKFGQQEET